MSYVLLINLFSTFAMTGIIWLIQLTHYPSFRYVEIKAWPLFHTFHTGSITLVVAPLMMAQLLSSITLLFSPLFLNYKFLLIINLALVCVVFIATAFISVPIHNKMAEFFDSSLIDFLILTNWIRTITWTLNSALLIYFLSKIQLI